MKTGFGILGTLAIIFMILKLTDVIDWSWWVVFSPLLGSFVVPMSLFLKECYNGFLVIFINNDV